MYPLGTESSTRMRAAVLDVAKGVEGGLARVMGISKVSDIPV